MYVVALLLVAAMLAPVMYIILGGFRTNAQITTDPAGLARARGTCGNYLDVLRGATFWREVAQLARSPRWRPPSASSRWA